MEIYDYVKNNNLLEVKKYLQFGDVNIKDNNSKSLLHIAVNFDSFDCINTLIENYIDLNILDDNGQSAIFDAAIKGKLGLVKILIRSGCNVNIKDKYGNIPLFYAIKTNNTAIVDLLYEYSDLTIKNIKEENASFIALKFNYHDLNKFSFDIDNLNYKNENLLHYAVKYNNVEIVKKYINRLQINKKNTDNESVFFLAVRYSNRDIIRILLKYLPSIDLMNKYSERLIDIVSLNHYEINDLIENYISSLDYIYYKKNYTNIYNYICYNCISLKNKNKKDNFSLSLIDYVNFNNDKINAKKLTKVQ